MRANFMLLAEFAGLIKDGGPTISNVFRIHQVSAFPAPFEAYVAIEVEIDPHEVGIHELVLRLIDEDGASLWEEPLGAEFLARPGYMPNYAYDTPRIRTLVLRPGIHRLDL